MLRIQLLGPPAITDHDQPVQVPRRKHRALLYYLAARGEPVSRAELIDLFFSEAGSGEEARRHVREALSKIRGVLPEPETLVTKGDRVWLDPQRASVDLVEFREIIQQMGRTPWQLPLSQPLPAAVFQLLFRAVRLWRSPRFMAGADLPSSDQLDDWLTRTTQELEHIRGQILQRLADHTYASGDLEASLHWLRMALETDELNEDLHFRVLKILSDLGRRTEAVKYFSTLQDLYRQELGTAPPAAVQSLYTRIQSEVDAPLRTDRPGWPVSLSMQVPYVGQEQLLNDLRLAFHRGGLVAVFGEAGAGKSRLVQELFFSIEPVPRLLLAPSHPLENSLPFQPLIELLRHSVQPEDWQALPPVWVSQLSILLPELLIMRPEIPPQRAQISDARALLFEAFRQLFTHLARKQPLLFFLDDAQWADEATLATLSYLVERSFFKDRGLLVIAARAEEPNPHLDELLARSRAQQVFMQVNLEQLTEQEISRLTQYALGQTPSPEFVRHLAQETGGNPFFLLETLRAILELSLGPDLSHVPEALPLASSIHALVRNRLRSLTPNARQTLTAAAITGNEFSPLVIEKITRSTPEQVVQALDELESAHLIRSARAAQLASGDPTYSFIHDKIREVMELELSPARKRLLHQRAGHALEETLGANAVQSAPVLALHFELGGSMHLAFHYWILAGQRARQLFSLTEAYAAYRRAEGILQALGSNLTDDHLYQLYSGWGELAFEVNDQETLSQVYNKLLHLGEGRHSLLLVGTALSGLGSLSLARERFAEGLIYIDQALPFLKQAGSEFEHTQALVRRGALLRFQYRFEEAVEAFQAALALSEASLDPAMLRARSSAHNQLSLVFSRTGWPVEGKRFAELALQHSAWSSHPLSEVRAYHVLALGDYQTGRYDQARSYSQKGVELAERIGSWLDAGRLHVLSALVEFATGNLEDYWKHLEASFRFGERAHSQRVISEAYCLKGDLYLETGETGLAVETYQQGITGGHDTFEGLDALTHMGLCIGLDGRIDSGLMYLEQALGFTKKVNLKMLALTGEVFLATLKILQGQVEPALELLDQVEQEARQRQIATIPCSARLLRAQVALSRGCHPEAAEISGAVMGHARKIGNVWLEIRALHLLIQAQVEGQGAVDPAHPTRLESLFEQLESSASVDSLRRPVQNYRQRILAAAHPN